jgi:Fe-S cluster assembly protein SufD
VYVHHQGPQTLSRVTYKGALHGKGARTVWVGDVLIGAEAVGTDSYEQNRNLVLSDGTRADSIPNLEIKTGDIAGAGHASATGRFDDEQLFYLQSRGIEELDARRLVVMGFLVDVVSKINDPALVAELTDKFQQKLSHTVEG